MMFERQQTPDSDLPSRRRTGWAGRVISVWGVGVLVYSLLFFLLGSGRTKVVLDHEARVIQTAQSMVQSGWPWAARNQTVDVKEPGESRVETAATRGRDPDREQTFEQLSVNPWLIPVYRGQIRLQKPPLPYWVTAVCFAVLGETPFAARLGPAGLMALGTLLVYRLARLATGRGASRTAAVLSVAVWLSTFVLLDESRKAMSDPYLTVFSLLSITLYAELSTRGEKVRRAAGKWALLSLALALGALSKGPVIFLHAAVAGVAYSAATLKWPRWHVAIVPAVILFFAVTLPWPLYVIKHLPHALEVWRYESIGEFADNTRNARPWHFYLPQLAYIPLPWTGVALGGVALLWYRRQRAVVFAVSWIAAAVVVFSFAHLKKNAYLLPELPALAILTGATLSQWLARARQSQKAATFLRQALFAHTMVGVGFAVTIAVMMVKQKTLGGQWPLAVLGFAGALYPLRAVLTAPLRTAMLQQALAFSMLIWIFVSFPGADHDNRRKAIALDPTTEASLDGAPAALPSLRPIQ